MNISQRRRTGLVAAALLAAVLLPLPAAHASAAQVSPGTVLTAAEPEPAYSQDFSGPGLPEGFTAVDGAWKVENGRLYGTSTSSSQLSRVTFGPHLPNYRFEATVRFENVLNAGRWSALALDMKPDGGVPFWIATMRSGTKATNGLEFAERTAANGWNVTETASTPSDAGTGNDVRVAVEVRGRNAVWYFNGQEMMETNRLIRTDSGILGLVANGATVSYDDIKVTELPATESLLVKPGQQPAVIAHRGESAIIPENTLQALLSGGRAGADWIEMDVNTSKDGVPVVIHDNTVDRVTAGTGDVSTLTAGYIAGLEAGSWFAPAYAGAKVPTLAEFLDQTNTEGTGLLLEVKGPETREEVQRTVEMLKERGMLNQTILQSFDTNVLQYARDYEPSLRLGLLRGALDTDVVAAAKQFGAVTYNPSWSALAARPAAIKELHDAGIAVMPYTVDNPRQWKDMTDAGVDGIITNRAGALVGFQSALGTAPTPAAPTVRFAGNLDGVVLGRADTVAPAVETSNVDHVSIQLDGQPIAEGDQKKAASLALGEHTLTAKATGPGGEATASLTFTVQASKAGLYTLLVTAGVDSNVRDRLMKNVDRDRWQDVAADATAAAGKGLPPELAAIIAGDAAAL
ncbi:glycerophosphodiester phosphodiesterase family protein [Pseudarthrobacter sp. SSS035]|uniref:glycerophosphodiester phosphodiesterase family protein n=1 Tax=Pseudarthrobacter sp. SSS035 TaxID=2931399 RepID=UPI00200D010A|nr:glycerophosphodiester phosphodiesterase family protein [Pseudarthrobacter sp. SSS035]